MGDVNGTATLRNTLRLLTINQGVERPDLVQALQGELRELQHYWKLDLTKGVDAVREAVRQRLNSYIGAIQTPRQARQPITVNQRRRQYQQVAQVYFNVTEDPELAKTGLTQRRLWLADNDRSHLRIAVSTGQDDFNHALDQIVEQMIASAPARLKAEPASDPTPAPVAVEPPVQTSRLGKRRPILVTAGVLVAMALVTGTAYSVLSHGTKTPKSSTQAKGATRPSASSSSSTVASSGIPTGNYLSMTPNIAGYNFDVSAVFPSGSVASAPPDIFTQTQVPDGIPSESNLPAEEMADGGYLLGGAAVTTDVRAVGTQQVTINNVRVVNLTRLPIVTGKAFIIFGQGGGNEDIEYMLDDPMPVGISINPGVGYKQPWGEYRHSTVTSSKDDTITLDFVALQYAYTFNVAFDYEVNGQNYTQVLDGTNDKPLLMRVSADLCPSTDFRSQMSSADLEKLSGLHYSAIRSNVMTDLYSVATVDPKLYGPNGIACESAPHNEVGAG